MSVSETQHAARVAFDRAEDRLLQAESVLLRKLRVEVHMGLRLPPPVQQAFEAAEKRREEFEAAARALDAATPCGACGETTCDGGCFDSAAARAA